MRLVARCECLLHEGHWYTPANRSRIVKGWIVPSQPETPCPRCGRPADITVGLCLLEEPATT